MHEALTLGTKFFALAGMVLALCTAFVVGIVLIVGVCSAAIDLLRGDTK